MGQFDLTERVNNITIVDVVILTNSDKLKPKLEIDFNNEIVDNRNQV